MPKRKTKKQLKAEAEKAAAEAREYELEELKRTEKEEKQRLEYLAQKKIEDETAAEEELMRLKQEVEDDSAAESQRQQQILKLKRSESESRDWRMFTSGTYLPDAAHETELNAFLTLWDSSNPADEMIGVDIDSQYGVEMEITAAPLPPEEFPAPVLGLPSSAEDAKPIVTSLRVEPHLLGTVIGQDGVRELLERTLLAVGTTEQVIALLESSLTNSAQENETSRLQWGGAYRRRFRDITARKLDQMTVAVLKTVTEMPDGYGEAKRDESKEDVSSNRDHERDGVDLAGALESKTSQICMAVSSTQAVEASLSGPDRIGAADTVPDEAKQPDSVSVGLWIHTSKTEKRRKGLQYPIVFDEIGVEILMPSQISMGRAPLALRVIHTTYDHLSTQTKNQGQISYRSLGGIFNLDQLNVPEPAKRLKGWIIRENSEKEHSLSVVPYNPTIDTSVSLSGQCYRVTFPLPSFVYLGPDQVSASQPKVGWWDREASEWRHDGVRSTIEGKTIRVEAALLAPMALIQPRALDFPYRSWSFTLTGSTRAIFRLEGARFALELELLDSEVRLLAPEAPELAHLRTQWFSPGVFLQQLARSGVNLIPTDEDAHFTRKPVKSKAAEQRMHDHLSRVAGAFNFRGTAFNSTSDTNTCTVEIQSVDAKVVQEMDVERARAERIAGEVQRDGTAAAAEQRSSSPPLERLERGGSLRDQVVEEEPEAQSEKELKQDDDDDDGDDDDNGDDRNDEKEEKAADESDELAADSQQQEENSGKAAIDQQQWTLVVGDERRFYVAAPADRDADLPVLLAPHETVRIIDGQSTHFSMARCLHAYYGSHVSEQIESVPLGFQMATLRLLNLVRVFTFY